MKNLYVTEFLYQKEEDFHAGVVVIGTEDEATAAIMTDGVLATFAPYTDSPSATRGLPKIIDRAWLKKTLGLIEDL